MNSVLWVEYCIYVTNSFKKIISIIKSIFNMTVNYLHWIHSYHYRNIIHLVYMFLSCELLCSHNFLVAIIVLRKYCLIDIDDIYRFLKKRLNNICVSSSKFDVFWSIIFMWELLFIIYWISHRSEMPSNNRTRIRDSINPHNMLCQRLRRIKRSLLQRLLD